MLMLMDCSKSLALVNTKAMLRAAALCKHGSGLDYREVDIPIGNPYEEVHKDAIGQMKPSGKHDQ